MGGSTRRGEEAWEPALTNPEGDPPDRILALMLDRLISIPETF